MSERTYAPRSGGRIAEQRGDEQPSAAGRRGRYRDGRAVDAPTQGTSALQPADAPARDTGSTPRLRVAPPVPIQAPRAPFIVLVLVLVVAGVFGILLINTKTNENTFKLSKLQDQQNTLDNQQQSLENQIAGYESTGNLDAAARRLGLVKADTPAYIRLPDGKIIGVPKPGEGRPAVTAEDPAAAKQTATGASGSGAPKTAASSPTGNGTITQNAG